MRIYLDKSIANQLSIDALQNVLLTYPHTFVVTEDVTGISMLIEDPEFLEEMLRNKQLIIEVGHQPNPVDKESVKDLPNADNIINVTNMVIKYGLPKGTWKNGLPLGDLERHLASPRDFAEQHTCHAFINADGALTLIC